MKKDIHLKAVPTKIIYQGKVIYTHYAASRSFALLVVILSVGRFRSPQALLALSAVMTLIQLGNAVIGFQLHDAAKSFGPLGLAVLTFVAALFLMSATHQQWS
ncbi:hypothetical protein [Deinococcus marmoris]|uniref:Uncharacterized protein n=1 Tax=Deinococcus marmoris TaxID=249408 RepID=A0A1U7NRI5_9DEIO|nr:hypothetical protein [Deinococcus marmoris]OLV15531.1 hypothetical protein BOO71_0014614 [Deinococcus marmoris]